MAGADEQLVKPEVADVSNVPLPAGFKPLMKVSMPGDAVAAMPCTPKAFVVDTVPSLRKPMPFVPPLPALVLPEMFKQTVVLVPAAEGVPEFT